MIEPFVGTSLLITFLIFLGGLFVGATLAARALYKLSKSAIGLPW